MTVGKSRQGLHYRLFYLSNIFAFFIFLSLVGCAPRAVGVLTMPEAPDEVVQQEPAPEESAACPPVQSGPADGAMDAQRVAPSSFEYYSALSLTPDFSRDLTHDADYATVLSEPEPAPSFQSLEEVSAVPSISEIVLAQYDDWRGVRYRAGGSDSRGVDCSGLVHAVFKDAFDMDVPRTSTELSRLGESVPKEDIRPGDLLYFIDRGRKHVGVAVNATEFLHSSRRKGVILSKFDGYWAPRLMRVRRILNETVPQVSPPKGG
jgi:cell wall-associated NlpC family hydrolase